MSAQDYRNSVSPMQGNSSVSPRSSVADRYRVLLEIARTLSATLSLDELYAAIYHETARVLEAGGFYVSLYDADNDRARVVFYADRGQIQHAEIEYPGAGSAVIQSRRATLLNNGLDGRSVLLIGEEGSDLTRSAISAPLVHKGRVLGVISAQSYEAEAYGYDDLDLLQAIADLAAVAVANAQHVAELSRRQREAEKVEEIGRLLTGSLDPKVVLETVIRAVQEVIDVDGASVWLREGAGGLSVRVSHSGGTVTLPIGLTWQLPPELTHRLFAEKEVAIIDDLGSSQLLPESIREHLRYGSGIGAPLLVNGHVAGVLTAGSRHARHFNSDDQAVLKRLARQASVALENARLHSNLQAASLTDPLTGLPNRRHLQIHLEREIAAAQRGRYLVVALFDLNDFKRYNDAHGHLAGDDILRAFAQILDEENRAMNLVARFGGDEFVSVLSDTHLAGAENYVSRVSKRVLADPILGAHGISVSCGMAEFDPQTLNTSHELLKAADRDMYRAKSRKLERAATSE